MNNKAAIGLVAGIIVLALAYFVLNRPTSEPTGLPVATTTPTAATTSATAPGATGIAAPVRSTPSTGIQIQSEAARPTRIVAFDTASLTSTATRPRVTGTANVTSVALVFENAEGVGIASSSNIPVVAGRWSYAAPQALKPGTYTLHLIGGESTVIAKLVVN